MSDPKMHPLLGGISDEGEPVVTVERDAVHEALPVELPSPEPPTAPKQKSYCETCGHVDSHATDCPEVQPAHETVDVAELANEDSLRRQLRKLGATVLRRLAKKLDR